MTNVSKQVADTILAQLGGRRFVVMTGASSFSHGEFGPADSNRRDPGLSFRLPARSSNGVAGVIITLDPSDTYRIRFLGPCRAPSYTVKTIADLDGVYVDVLRETFTRYTGLETSLGTMRATA